VKKTINQIEFSLNNIK